MWISLKTKKKSNAVAAVSENLPQQATSEIVTAASENTYSAVPELRASTSAIEETPTVASSEKAIKEKNKFFQNNPILKHFTGSKIQESKCKT